MCNSFKILQMQVYITYKSLNILIYIQHMEKSRGATQRTNNYYHDYAQIYMHACFNDTE